MTDRPEVFVTGIAEGDERARLTIRCRRDRTEVFLTTTTYLGTMDSQAVMLRLGERPAITQRWSPSTDGRGVFAPSPIEFARALLGASTLRVEMQPQHAGRIQLRFEMVGYREALAPLQAACNWR